MPTGHLPQDVWDELKMSWLSPKSAISALICPDLVEKAKAENWNTEKFFIVATPRLLPWISRKLCLWDFHLASDVVQNFTVVMTTQRPDLFHDPSRGTLEKYILGIARNMLKVTRREEGIGHNGTLAFDPADSRGEDSEAARQRRIRLRLVRRLMSRRSTRQREALAEKYASQCPLPFDNRGRTAIYLRRHLAIKAIRKRVIELGLKTSRCGPARRRTRRRRVSVYSRHLRAGRPNPQLTPAEIEQAHARQMEVDASNALALQALLNSLPQAMKDQVEILAGVKEVFHQRFAKKVPAKGNRRIGESDVDAQQVS